MVEVKMVLYDAVEVSMYAQLCTYLEAKRSQPAPSAAAPVGAETPAAAPAEYTGPVLVPDAPPAAVAVPVTDDAVGDALVGYARRAGLDAAHALLESFGAKRAGDVKPEDRAEFIGRTQESTP